MSRPNNELREAIEKKRIRRFEIANELGISGTTVYRWLTDEKLSEDKKKLLWAAIAKIC